MHSSTIVYLFNPMIPRKLSLKKTENGILKNTHKMVLK